jgi:hypothetical protein
MSFRRDLSSPVTSPADVGLCVFALNERPSARKLLQAFSAPHVHEDVDRPRAADLETSAALSYQEWKICHLTGVNKRRIPPKIHASSLRFIRQGSK